jgi:hypothetical protein
MPRKIRERLFMTGKSKPRIPAVTETRGWDWIEELARDHRLQAPAHFADAIEAHPRKGRNSNCKLFAFVLEFVNGKGMMGGMKFVHNNA